MIQFMLFNVKTRRLLASHREASTIHQVERQADTLGEGEDRGNLSYVFGHWNADTHYVNGNGEVRYIGGRRPAPELAQDPPEPATAAHVDAQTARRIERRYRLVDQINALRGDGSVDFAWIDAVRDAGRALKAMTPIPPDYADDRHWPANPDTTKGTPNG